MKIGKKFYYRASDRRTLVVLLCFAAACTVLLLFVGGNYEGNDMADGDSAKVFRTSKENFHSGDRRQRSPQGYYNVEGPKVELFPFDPNTADSTALLRLGLKPWQVRNIYKYRASGGIYSKPTDFARLYGLTVKQYKQLEPYIRISAGYQLSATLAGKERAQWRDTLGYPHIKKMSDGEYVVLNFSDTTALKRVPGIGGYYARTIIRYGERLGGYVSVDQLNDIEGFPLDAKSFFRVGETSIRRMNVNKMKLSELRRHPYMGYYRAKAITDYRRMHGHINSLNDLSLDPSFTPDAIARLLPYVEY